MRDFDSRKLAEVVGFLRERLLQEAPADPTADALARVVDFNEGVLSAHLRARVDSPPVGARYLETLGAPLWDTLVRMTLAWRDDPGYPLDSALFGWELSGAADMRAAMEAARETYLGAFAGVD